MTAPVVATVNTPRAPSTRLFVAGGESTVFAIDALRPMELENKIAPLADDTLDTALSVISPRTTVATVVVGAVVYVSVLLAGRGFGLLGRS